ncbi:MAG: patatin-like phospholipase family protein [Bacteroidetes bacterium]|nr:MAG: patatin-like phospholipase family protein [Bacteroidota bacterium]TAG86364.1 MAG: patatin-like phospholipase family protein [Bacteroidota bacterium]
MRNFLIAFYKRYFLTNFYYSFPIQLFFYNLKKNQLLLLFWFILLGIVTENMGVAMGVPFLLLEPEYLNQVNFMSCFLLGLAWGIFILSFHIICYLLDAPQFKFLGTLRRPFAQFLLNNSVIPAIVLFFYFYNFFHYQYSYEKYAQNPTQIWIRFAGLVSGILVSCNILYIYFIQTNYDIFKRFSFRFSKKSVNKNKIVRVNIFKDKNKSENFVRVDTYLNDRLSWKSVSKNDILDEEEIMHIFDQNHLNGVIIQMCVFGMVLFLGTLRDYPTFQLPAGASLVLLFTIVLMIAGALNYWFRGWAVSVTIAIIFIVNFSSKEDILSTKYAAYGLNYTGQKAEYSLRRVKELANDSLYKYDYDNTLIALENWKKKMAKLNLKKKPKIVFTCVSGGGQRAAMWVMRTLQYADSTLEGRLMSHTMLITGASGGMVGAGYFRELCLKREYFWKNESPEYVNPYDKRYLENIAKDNLNAIVFSLVVNDMFLGTQTFEYAGERYAKDRGLAFEQQFNRNTEGILDKSLCDYKEPEQLSYIPMMILSPTIVNDGRKLFVSPQSVSYMTTPRINQTRFLNQKTKGIDFLRFFHQQKAGNLRFLTAMRMSATFPYVTPNVKLPSQPEMEIMDAGLSDNFGVGDATRFIYTFRKWIEENTSGIVILSIRDSQKDQPMERKLEPSLFQKIFTPVTSFFENLEYLQDITNDNLVEYAKDWFPKDFGVHRIEFQYVPFSKNLKEVLNKQKEWELQQKTGKITTQKPKIVTIQQASLSWRLTQKEKDSIYRTIYELKNQSSLRQLKRLLMGDDKK